MTLDELVAATEGKRIIRHHFRCFFNVYSDEECAEWIARGAVTRPFSDATNVGHEVYLESMLDPILAENEDGEEIDVRGRVLLNFFRKRDGFAIPILAK